MTICEHLPTDVLQRGRNRVVLARWVSPRTTTVSRTLGLDAPVAPPGDQS